MAYCVLIFVQFTTIVKKYAINILFILKFAILSRRYTRRLHVKIFGGSDL